MRLRVPRLAPHVDSAGGPALGLGDGLAVLDGHLRVDGCGLGTHLRVESRRGDTLSRRPIKQVPVAVHALCLRLPLLEPAELTLSAMRWDMGRPALIAPLMDAGWTCIVISCWREPGEL